MSAIVAELRSRSNSARERTRLVLRLDTDWRLANVRFNFVSQPVQVIPEMLRMTCSRPATPFSMFVSIAWLGAISVVAIEQAPGFPTEQQESGSALLVFPLPQPLAVGPPSQQPSVLTVDLRPQRSRSAFDAEQQESTRGVTVTGGLLQQPDPEDFFFELEEVLAQVFCRAGLSEQQPPSDPDPDPDPEPERHESFERRERREEVFEARLF